MTEEGFDATNMNTLWLQNIFENLHNLEEMERLSREGVSNLVDYANLPEKERETMISSLQYKNLKMLVSEMYLLLTDIVPVVRKEFHKEKKQFLDSVNKRIREKELFIHSPVNQKLKRVIKIELKPFFYITLEIMASMREDIIQEIASLLYVKQEAVRYA